MDASEKSKPARDAKKVVKLSIFNQVYTVTTAGDPEKTERIAREIDDLMSTIARRAGNLDTARTAVLACLHLADKLHSVETELAQLRESVIHKTRDFASLLDSALLARHPSSEEASLTIEATECTDVRNGERE